MNSATKKRIDATKTASKVDVQKAAEATRDLIGNKIADKITSSSKTKSKGKKCQTNEMQKIYIPQEKTSTNQ